MPCCDVRFAISIRRQRDYTFLVFDLGLSRAIYRVVSTATLSEVSDKNKTPQLWVGWEMCKICYSESCLSSNGNLETKYILAEKIEAALFFTNTRMRHKTEKS